MPLRYGHPNEMLSGRVSGPPKTGRQHLISGTGSGTGLTVPDWGTWAAGQSGSSHLKIMGDGG